MSADSDGSTRTPSTDPINPQANAWISRDESGKLSEIASPASTPGTSRTANHVQAAAVQRLARRLGVDPEELAARISPEMLRRLKYPVHAVVNDDGTTTYLEDKGIVEGVQSGRGTDRADSDIVPGAARDSKGRYVK